MQQTALAPQVSPTATPPAVDPVREALLDRGIQILTELPPRRPSGIEERRQRAAHFAILESEFGTTQGEAHPLMVEVSQGKSDAARRFLTRKLKDMGK